MLLFANLHAISDGHSPKSKKQTLLPFDSSKNWEVQRLPQCSSDSRPLLKSVSTNDRIHQLRNTHWSRFLECLLFVVWFWPTKDLKQRQQD